MHFSLWNFKISPKKQGFFLCPEKPAPRRHFFNSKIAFICNFTFALKNSPQKRFQSLKITFKPKFFAQTRFKPTSIAPKHFQTSFNSSKFVSKRFQAAQIIFKPLSAA